MGFLYLKRNTKVFKLILHKLRHSANKLYSVIPTDAGVSDGLAVNTLANLLAAFFYVAFNHESLEELLNVFILRAAVHYLGGDAELFLIFLCGVCVVAVHDKRRIVKSLLRILDIEMLEVLVVIVGHRFAVLVYVAAENCVRQGVTARLNLPASVKEGVRVLSRHNRVEHYADVAARGILHTYGNLNSAGNEAVLLIFNRTRADSNVGKRIIMLFPV